jgi:hypothetical protein
VGNEFLRYAAGLEAGSLLGAELGYDARVAHGEWAHTHAVHGALFLSIALLSAGVRASIPFATSGTGENQGYEIGFEGTIKLPLGNYGQFMHGRLPRRGVVRYAHRTTNALARMWGDRACDEFASITTFLALARDLAAHAAPPSLVMRARRAAREEWHHARVALGAARAFGGEHDRWTCAAFAPVGATLATLVEESLMDGVVGEQEAAASLMREAERFASSPLRDAVVRVAREEATHAALAYDVVRWAVSSPRQARRPARSRYA